MFDQIGFPDIYGCVEILCLTVMFYYVLFFFRGTRATPVFTGFVLVFIILIVFTRFFRLEALNWLLGRFSVYLFLAFLVIFQPEIRRVLADLGKQHIFGNTVSDQRLVDCVVQSAMLLAKRRIGALIAIERDIGTKPIQATGVVIDSAVTPEMLASIFYPHTPLHDGGVIIAGNRIAAARCMFPLSQREEFTDTIGTRHLAAVGMTEETDAVTVVVSEETAAISAGYKGRLVQYLDEQQLHRFLTDILLKPKQPRAAWSRVKTRLGEVLKSFARWRHDAGGAPP